MRVRSILGLLLLGAGLAQAQTTSIEVRDRTGAGVAGARIEIRSGTAIATTATTDEQGAASVPLSPGTYRVRVSADGFVAGWSGAFTQAADVAGRAEVRLFPGSALAGTMLDDNDRKVPAAELCLSLHESRSYPPSAFGDDLFKDGEQCWQSDEQGRLATPVLPLGRYDLSIEADGRVPRETTLELESDHPAQQWRLERGGSVTGLVRDREDEPVGDAVVRLRHRELELERDSATGEDGRFTVGGLAPGPWTVRIEPRNAALILRDGVLVEEGVTLDLGAMRVRPGLGIDGIVRDANGEALAGATVQVRTADPPSRPLRTVESDDEGRFLAAGLDEAAVHLLIDAPEGHASAALEDLEPPLRNVEFELEATGSVCGVVLTEEGTVAARTAVSALPGDLGLLDDHPNFVRATTREVDPESGRFCVEDVHPGEVVTVTANAAGFRKASVETPVNPGEETGPVELTLRRGLTLEGTVVARGGQPLRDAAVRGGDTPRVYTDGFGEFRLSGLDSGMNTVIAEHPDHAMAQREVMLPLGLEEDFRIELGGGGTIEGTVMRTNGEPVEGVSVALSDPGRERMTDAEGKYRFDGVPPGERTVTRNARGRYDDFEHRRIEIVEGETIRVDFELGVVLEGNVVRGGVPVPGVTIALAQPRNVTRVTDSNHAVQRTFSDETGAYRLSGVRPGWGTVTLERGREQVVRMIEVPPGDTPRLDLRLPDRPVYGTVVNGVDESGIAGAHVGITLAPVEGAPESGGSSSYSSGDEGDGIRYNLTSQAESRTTTDADGNFEAYADPLPEIEVSGWAAGFRWTSVTVDPGSRAPVTIELARETTLIVKLRDPQGNPASGALVCAERRTEDGNSSRNCSMGGSDQVRFSLDEGKYKIQASARGFGTQVFEREMQRNEDGSATTVTVDLVPGAALAISLAGNPVEGAHVASLIDPAGAERNDLVREGTVDPATGDRRWSTWTLNPGTWTVTVDDGTGKAIVRQVEVVAGTAIQVGLP